MSFLLNENRIQRWARRAGTFARLPLWGQDSVRSLHVLHATWQPRWAIRRRWAGSSTVLVCRAQHGLARCFTGLRLQAALLSVQVTLEQTMLSVIIYSPKTATLLYRPQEENKSEH